MSDFNRSREYYKKNLQRLAAEYEGRYIAIVDENVVDSDAEFSSLAERVYKRFGRITLNPDRGIETRDIYMPRVEKEPSIARVRSPKIS